MRKIVWGLIGMAWLVWSVGCPGPLPDREKPSGKEAGIERIQFLEDPGDSGNKPDAPPPERGTGNDLAIVNCIASECNSPPASICQGTDTIRVYGTRGTCHPTEDRCVYTFRDEPCDGVCRGNTCYKKDHPCARLDCEKPDPPKCLNATSLRTYQSPGTCKDAGICEYGHSDQSCPHGCKDGKCQADPCKGKKCSAPPGPSCTTSKALRISYNPGTCRAGKCIYPHADQTCPRGCSKGQCNVGTGFTPLSPFRFLDTRGSAKVAAESTRCIAVGGKGGVPSNARAVYVNVVAVDPSAPGFLTAYPNGVKRPITSTLNYITADTIANGAIVKLGTKGEICIYSKSQTHLIVDVYGHFDSDSDFEALGPFRRLDTRSGAMPGKGSTRCVKVAGRDGIPTDAKALFINLVAVNPADFGHLTVYPKGITRPTTSALNYPKGQTIANGAVVKPGAQGEICIYTHAAAHLIIDVTGYFGVSSSFSPVGPIRRLDTRSNGGGPVAAGSTLCHQITGLQGIPPAAKAVAINIAGVQPSETGFLTVFPNGHGRPNTSTLNLPKAGVRANNALVQPGSKGQICIYNLRTTHYVLDITGYWLGSGSSKPCTGVTCNNPPPPTCVGGAALVSYTKTGSCKNGTCIYPSKSQTCAYKCSGSKCVAAPPPPPPPPTHLVHPVTSWQLASQPVSSGSGMDLKALRYITIHYNGGRLDLDGADNVYQDADFIQILRNMQGGYLRSRGYSLGYNSAIAPDGDEWIIRGTRYRAASNGCTAVNRPAYTIIIPTTNIANPPTQAQIQGAQRAIARIRAAAKAAGNPHTLTINGHRDVRPLCGNGGTACPGEPIYKLIKNGTLR